jgi:recombination protein RecA
MVAETRLADAPNGSTAEVARSEAKPKVATSKEGILKDGTTSHDAKPGRSKQRQQAIQSALGQIEKQFGKGSIMTLGGNTRVEIQGISTGSVSLDLALGGYGLPRGRITEVFGPESSGKTTLCLHVIANAQKAGGVCAFVDAEHAFDASYAKQLGVDLDELLVSQPDTGEQALEIAETLIRSNAIDVIVIDSVAALVPKAEIEGEMGDSHVGLQARLMSQALRKLSGAIRQSNAVMIFTNQIRMKIGVMFGNPETTSGGNALKFYASVRLDMRRIGSLKGANDVVVGNRTRAKVVKNKIAPPFRMAEFDILFGKGIDRLGDLVDLATNAAVIEKSGSWLSWKDQKLGQGRDKAREFLLTQPDLVAGIEKDTALALSPSGGGAVLSSAPDAGAEADGTASAAAPKPASATSLAGGPGAPSATMLSGAAPANVGEATTGSAPAPGANRVAGLTDKPLVPSRVAEKPAAKGPLITKKTLPPRPFAKRTLSSGG